MDLEHDSGDAVADEPAGMDAEMRRSHDLLRYTY